MNIQKVKYSIRLRMIVTLAGLFISSIFLCWFLNKTLLEDYYQSSKLNTLETMYTNVQTIYEDYANEKITDEEFEDQMYRIGANENVSVFLFTLYWNNKNQLFTKNIYPAGSYRENSLLGERIQRYFYNELKHPITSKEEYQIFKVLDSVTQSDYLELYGDVDVGVSIYLRSNYAAITESADISNKFLAYAALFVGFVGVILMYFITRSFTQPVVEITGIAKKMSNLDFDVKYKVETQDELGVLGESINLLSERLETTISELKSANNELEHDIQQKIEIDEMRKEFLSNVTHELKTPIALIQGYAEGLLDNINDDSESKDFYCEVIIDEANKMNTMVKKLLSLNQLESGNSPVSFERFDVVELIQSVIHSTEILYQQKDVRMIFKQTEPIYVWADEYMIEEVITNYVSNAIHHVKDPNIIEIQLIQHKDVLRVAVFNTGDCIPEADLDNVWVKFYKVDKARTREYGGSGIGLSIVKAIMDSHNQRYGVANRENGVEFWFELDRKDS